MNEMSENSGGGKASIREHRKYYQKFICKSSNMGEIDKKQKISVFLTVQGRISVDFYTFLI